MIKRGKKEMVICDWCGLTIEKYPSDLRNHNFCNLKCYGFWKSEIQNGENNPNWQGGKILLSCTLCKGEYKRTPAVVSNSRFCSNDCKSEWRTENWTGENSPTWQGGKTLEPYGPNFNDTLKEMIRDRDGRTCQDCGKSETDIGRRLDVHHIDENKKNNDPENLISLCPSCHMSKRHG